MSEGSAKWFGVCEAGDRAGEVGGSEGSAGAGWDGRSARGHEAVEWWEHPGVRQALGEGEVNPVPLSALARRAPRSGFERLSHAVRRRYFLQSCDVETRAKFLELHPCDLERLQKAALKRARKDLQRA